MKRTKEKPSLQSLCSLLLKNFEMHPLYKKADELSYTAIGAAIEVHRSPSLPLFSFVQSFLGTKPQGERGFLGLGFLHENINLNRGGYMLRWAAIFFIIAIIAALLGFTGVAGAAANIAVFLFYLFVAVFVVLLLLGLFVGRRL